MNSNLDDEITALAMQLEEIYLMTDRQKGKYRENQHPDPELALATFLDEVRGHVSFLEDQKFAHSIASAVATDYQAIADLVSTDQQTLEDRRFAAQFSNDENAEPQAPPPYAESISETFITNEIQTPASSSRDNGNTDAADDDELSVQAEPPMAYVDNQEKALKRFSMGVQCSVCLDTMQLHQIIRLDCHHRYCHDCLKNLFMRSTTDQTLFPPKCCRQQIPLSFVLHELSAGELEQFQNAEAEFSTKDRTYCSNRDCGKFIPPSRIISDRAECGNCGSATCTMCKTPYHSNDCPADLALQAILELAMSERWKRCFSCKAMVAHEYGCWHMT
ncbi:hypothetical protein LOZ12_002920 [Ophidiomyces ophidiicola]|uniref:Uncharacterized protein n=1 Tax=Ophidiomyces ophidiicola TaxID=1387563 RepID=A0ACB8UZF1_9EURO|nr:uncharacterized protein LOZ57_004672 [Ophidiomyces ophidiicola]KAI1917289.1 hypothetical protein LOZ64_003126 [Ophidiomyces ophidiicola]KAI1944659.1 hypothetical protein LOZ57_004672 [Ophidiomyces ophidiicola]KAI1953286.1 hypothetical protein LOZ62_001127 [Ophidiomyces ophidiicola]KAI2006401.1 hypothetical protein LOZ50_003126 [Ophidiomyces ophidiicola]KAI2033442.1 hypothetical protein LOZ45_000726 [Ophidiomyces ophidiicola]